MNRGRAIGITFAIAATLAGSGCGDEEDPGSDSASSGNVTLRVLDWEPNVLAGPEGSESAVAGDAEDDALVVSYAAAERTEYYAIRDEPEIGNADVTDASAEPSAAGEGYAINIELTPDAAERFEDLTGEVAQRSSPGSEQHFAVILDDEVLSLPIIDPQASLSGISAEDGVLIEGGFTAEDAEEIAAALDAGGSSEPAPPDDDIGY